MSNDSKRSDRKDPTGEQEIPAGCFSSWLRRIRYALIKENGINVDCGDCKACCTSSYFIHIRPEETRTLTRIPRALLFPAPGLPKGNVLLGYDENGRCPMQADGKCSIYNDRPLTCRNYDCRVFAAAGIEAGEDDKTLINQRVRHWKFSYPTKCDQDQHLAVKTAAKFLREHAVCFPNGIPNNPSQLAILAIKVYDVFLKYNKESGKPGSESSEVEVAEAIMKAYEKFEARL